MQQQQLLSIPEAAALFGVKPKTVSLWCRTGLLEDVRLTARTVKIKRSSVDRLIERSSRTRQPDTLNPVQAAPQWLTGSEALGLLGLEHK
jgi:excisionase family DNA binding protein